jgi:hypothetical protein
MFSKGQSRRSTLRSGPRPVGDFFTSIIGFKKTVFAGELKAMVDVGAFNIEIFKIDFLTSTIAQCKKAGTAKSGGTDHQRIYFISQNLAKS